MAQSAANARTASDEPSAGVDVEDDADFAVQPKRVAPARGVSSVAEKKAEISGAIDTASPSLVAKPVSKTADSPGLAWGIPPISWRGSYGIGYSYSMASQSAGATTLSQTLNLGGSSYVYQPWFATVNGSATFSLQSSKVGESSSSGRGKGLSLGVGLLPRTRFGSNLSFSQGENSSVSGGVTTTYNSTSVGLNQVYTPPSGSFRSNLRLDQNKINSAETGTDTIDSIGVTVSVPLTTEAPQTLSFSAASTQNKTSRVVGGSSFSSATANHSIYLEDYVFTLNSDFLYNANELNQPESTSQSTLLQAGSSFDWIPSDDYPLTIRGNLRALSSDIATEQAGVGGLPATSQASKVTSYFGSSQATYPLGQQWTLGGGLNVVSTTSSTAGGDSRFDFIGLNANAGWTGLGYRTKFGEYDYGLSYGAGAGGSWNKSNALASSILNANGSVGHNVSRSILVSGRPMGFTGGQSLGVSKSSISEATTSLAHSLSWNWSIIGKADSSLSSSAQMSDSRSYGQSNSYQQSINASLFGNLLTSAYSSVSANLAAGFSRQGITMDAASAAAASSSTSTGSGWQGYGSGGVTYTHSRFADVSGLYYTAIYQMSIRPSAQRSLGDATSTPYELDHRLDQRWNWRMGLLGWQIENSFMYSGSTLSGSLGLSVTRDFGGML